MGIELEPTELSFQRPFTREVTQTLRIRNHNRDPVAFKVKTTAPKQYCVRPNSGRIESGKEVPVQVLLQAMRQDPSPDFKCRDKFLVQSVPITADREAMSIQQLWSYVEKSEKSAIQEKKIRVVYLQSGEDAPSNGAAIGEVLLDSSPPPYASPSADREDRLATPTPSGSGPKSALKMELEEGSIPPAASGTPSSHGTPESELAAARAKIARLEVELQELGLRQRKVSAIATDSKERIGSGSMGTVTHPAEGIPVQICAALCLGAFFIAWYFF